MGQGLWSDQRLHWSVSKHTRNGGKKKFNVRFLLSTHAPNVSLRRPPGEHFIQRRKIAALVGYAEKSRPEA